MGTRTHRTRASLQDTTMAQYQRGPLSKSVDDDDDDDDDVM
jgi:hypothetical protein